VTQRSRAHSYLNATRRRGVRRTDRRKKKIKKIERTELADIGNIVIDDIIMQRRWAAFAWRVCRVIEL